MSSKIKEYANLGYLIGSRAWGRFTAESDWDYIIDDEYINSLLCSQKELNV